MNFSGISDRTVLGRALRLPLRLVPANAQVRILQGRLRGKRWIAGSSNHGCWLGSYEHNKQKVFSAVVKHGDVVFDVGANVGFYSLLASVLVGPAGRVFGFEPNPRNLDLLHTHLKLNRVTNCSVLDVAVGCLEGTANFDLGSTPSLGHLTAQSHNTLSVSVVALDHQIATGRLPPPNVIKCDIEGWEYDALRGAAETLAQHAPTIFLATHGLEVHESCCTLLTSLHYQLTSLDGLPLGKSSEILATQPTR